jgi:hypothetical protein
MFTPVAFAISLLARLSCFEIEVGEYRARCSCCKTFRAQVEGIEPRAEYTNRVREAVLDRLLDDRNERRTGAPCFAARFPSPMAFSTTASTGKSVRPTCPPIAKGRWRTSPAPALGVGLARRDFKDAHGLLEDAAALRPTQPDDSVAADTRSAGRWCEGAFRDDGPDGIVADATEQVAVGIDDVLEELILGVAAINDIEPLGLQGGPQLLPLRAVSVREGGFDSGGRRMDVHFGGAVRLFSSA